MEVVKVSAMAVDCGTGSDSADCEGAAGDSTGCEGAGSDGAGDASGSVVEAGEAAGSDGGCTDTDAVGKILIEEMDETITGSMEEYAHNTNSVQA